tara:strand:+ start:170 stop:790 length:621 start_codon:yes stop_codon:yes gene_type:complete
MEKLYDDLIKKLIEIGRSEIIPSIPDSEFSYLKEGKWQLDRYPDDCDIYGFEELKSLYKGLVLCEKHFEWKLLSTTNTAWVYRHIEERSEFIEDYQERKEIYEFGFNNPSGNPHSPANSSGYETYEEYLKESAASRIEGAKNAARMFEIEQANKRLAATKKEFNEKAKEKRMKEHAERKIERDKTISIIEKKISIFKRISNFLKKL